MMRKQFLSILLCICMALSLLPVSAAAGAAVTVLAAPGDGPAELVVEPGKEDHEFSVSFTPKGEENAKNVTAVYSGSSDGAKVSIEFGDKLKADVTARDGALLSAAVVLTPPQGGSSVIIADTDDIANILAAADAAADIGAAVLSAVDEEEITVPQDLAPQVLIAPAEGAGAAGLAATVDKGLLSGLLSLGGALTVQADNDAARGALTLRGAGLDAAITQAGGNNNIEFRVQQVEEIYLSGNFGEDMGGRILPGTALRVDILAGIVSLDLGKSGGAAEVSLYPPVEIDPNLLMGVHAHNNSVTELYIQPDTAFADAMDKIERDESDPLVKPLKSDYTLDLTHFSAVGLVLASWQDAADTSWYDATQNDFPLTTAAQLAGLAELVNDGNDFEGKTITLGENIDLSGANWTPIGDENHSFAGSFNGGGHSISNMSIRIEGGSAKQSGLFGFAIDARIENLTVGGSIHINAVGKDASAGGVAGVASVTHMENCASSVDIDITLENGYLKASIDCYAGGIAGRLIGEGDDTDTVVGCSNTGSVKVTSAGNAHAGGIVGELLSDRVYNSYNAGDVTVTNANTGMVGGIAGAIYKLTGGTAYIANCYSVADITCNGSPSIVPSVAGAMYNCYAYSNTVARGAYYNGFRSVSDIENADELKALVSTLNAWVKAPTVTLDTTTETPFAPWYVSAQYNDGFPCFTQYIAPPDPGPSYDYYIITVSAGAGGAISPEGRVSVREGLDKRFVVTPDEGYKIYDVLADGERVGAVTEYAFENVRKNHTVSAQFAQVFSDVSGEWFAGDVDYVAAMGLMEGTGGGLFSPYLDTSRGMIVTILWRMEGTPAATEPMRFTDVPPETYYHGAVAWAAEHEIVRGYHETAFGPEDSITREQLAAILWRYAKYKGYDVSVGADTNILSYTDALAISEYAIPAMQWSCGSGLIQGDGGRLMPQGDAERCHAAAILRRFCEQVAK